MQQYIEYIIDYKRQILGFIIAHDKSHLTKEHIPP